MSDETLPRARVVLADDHVLLLDALSRLLQPSFDVVGTFSDGAALIEGTNTLEPEVVVLDITMPNMDGLAAAAQIRAEHPDTLIVFLTMHADTMLAAQAFRAGASAYLVKSAAASELVRAINEALAGRRYLSASIGDGDVDKLLQTAPPPATDKHLTAREADVVRLLARGLSMKEAARELGITPRTIAFHKYKIMQQLGIESNAELVRYAQRMGIAD
jgi:DNA-binding NarL/FixJ family response regulator